jgi:hypothetical protein
MAVLQLSEFTVDCSPVQRHPGSGGRYGELKLTGDGGCLDARGTTVRPGVRRILEETAEFRISVPSAGQESIAEHPTLLKRPVQ